MENSTCSKMFYSPEKRSPPRSASNSNHAHHFPILGSERVGLVEVLRQVAEGSRNRDIAEKLFISEETIKVHIKHLMDKLGAAHQTRAVAIGVRRGIIHL